MDLISIYQNDSESESPQSAESNHEIQFVDKNEVENWDGIEDRDCYITIKTVADVFVVPPLPESHVQENAYFLHFYRLHVETRSHQEVECAGTAAEELLNSIASINSIGIALRSKFSSDVLDTVSELYLLDATLTLKILYLGSKSTPICDITHMQRFHNAVYGQEDFSAFTVAEYLNLGFDFLLEAGRGNGVRPFTFMSDDKWTTSSNGSWFVVYPIEHSAANAKASQSATSYDIEYVKKCASEAQVLIHNLRVTALSDTTTVGNIPTEQSCGALPQDQWNGLVVLANSMSLCFVAADSIANRKTLNSVMKRVEVTKAPPPPLPAAVTASPDGAPRDVDGGGFWSGISSGEEEVSDGGEGSGMAGLLAPTTVNITYGEYLRAKRPHLAEAIERHHRDPTHRLIAANQISTKSTHTLMLSTISDQIKCSSEWMRRNSVFRPNPQKLHFLAEQCRPIGKLRWFHMTRLLPSVMYRVVSLQLAVECRELMKGKIEAAKASIAATPVPSRPETPQSELAPDQRMRDRITLTEPDFTAVPRVATMLEAMTPKMAIEHLDSERLETLGDAFLKYVISAELFRLWPDMREGKLTSLRSTFITNRKLCKVAFDSGIVPFIRALPLSRGERQVTICPPGMCTASELPDRSIWGMDVMKYPADRKYHLDNMFKYPVSQHHRHVIMYKKLSDMVESVIGAYYIDGGEAAAIATIKAFGIWPKLPPNLPARATPVMVSPVPAPPAYSTPPVVMQQFPGSAFHARFGGNPAFTWHTPTPPQPPSEEKARLTPPKPAGVTSDNYISPVYRKRSHSGSDEPLPVPSQLVTPIVSASPQIAALYANAGFSQAVNRVTPELFDFDDLEARLNYKFKDRSLLSLALTHTSVNRLLNGERLEFLGDAVLDFVVVSHWFKRNSAYEPCQLHDVKSKNSCNRNLANKAFKLGLHKFLQHKSDALQAQLDEFAASHAATANVANPCPRALLKGAESSSKVLADTFEALIGAIFLDSSEDIRSIEKFAAENDLFVGVL